MEAEHRLWPFAANLILVPGSLLLWGVGAAHEIHWFGLIVAMCMLAFTNTSGITLSVNYMVDSYRELSGVAMITVILVRNTMSFAIGYGYVFWFSNGRYPANWSLELLPGFRTWVTKIALYPQPSSGLRVPWFSS